EDTLVTGIPKLPIEEGSLRVETLIPHDVRVLCRDRTRQFAEVNRPAGHALPPSLDALRLQNRIGGIGKPLAIDLTIVNQRNALRFEVGRREEPLYAALQVVVVRSAEEERAGRLACT